jgi:actinin alpha
VEAALIFDNPHSEYTMEALRASWGQMISAQSRALNETENQILIRDSKGLSEEQITEYRKSFNHFDKVQLIKWAL